MISPENDPDSSNGCWLADAPLVVELNFQKTATTLNIPRLYDLLLGGTKKRKTLVPG